MISDQFLADLGIALQAQNYALKEIGSATLEVASSLTDSEQKLSTVRETTSQIKELEALMDELEAGQDWIEVEDFGDFDAEQIFNLYENRQQSVFRELTRIGFKDWDSFVRQCQIYALSQGIDPLAPYEGFLSETDLEILKSESYHAQYKWDKWDYIFVGASGVLASLTDYLLVRIPNTIKTGEYAGQMGSPITEWLKQYNTNESDNWFARWARYLSETCKVPYDSMTVNGEHIDGMGGKTHRFQSLGHDPVLGFVFGIRDILQNTVTGFSYDKGVHEWVSGAAKPNPAPVELIEAILRQIGHLISDVATPMGLPAPFMTLIQGINAGSFGEKERTVGEIARWMYANGYDLRHFLVSGITPAVIEIVLRAYIMLRHYSEHGKAKSFLASDPKYRSMLLMAHSIAALGNAGKIALMQGNPLAINYAEWLAFVRYLVPSMKYWLFDQHRLQMQHMERINATEWDRLIQNSDRLLATVTTPDASQIILGGR